MPDALYQALACLKAGHRPEARELFLAALSDHPDHPVALHGLGMIELQTGGFASALERLERAARLTPTPGILTGLALARHWTGDDDGALAAYGRLNDAAPEIAAKRRDIAFQRASTLSHVSRLRRTAGNTGAVTVYIKAHSRPAQLHRCLMSLRRYLSGHDGIVVMNDGIGAPYLDRLTALHPEARIVSSPKVAAGKLAAPPSGPAVAPVGPYCPARFWADVLAADDNAYMLQLEEDCWLTAPLDLAETARLLAERGALSLNLLLHRADDSRLTVIDRAGALDFYVTDAPTYLDGFWLFGLSNGVFRTDYWRNSYDNIPRWTDEMYATRRARAFCAALRRAEMPYVFAKTRERACRTTTWSTTRPDAGGAGIATKIDPVAINQAINDAWAAGELDVCAGMPDDFDATALARAIAPRIGDAAMAQLMRWREEFLRMYQSIGQHLD